jgi:hypothetical protein
MIGRGWLLMAALSGCARSAAPPWSPPWSPIEVDMIDAPVIEDCAQMWRQEQAGETWSVSVARSGRNDMVVLASDESWIVRVFSAPPPRTGKFNHDSVALALRCGGEHRQLAALACRGGSGLRLYVDAGQLADLRNRGSSREECSLIATIDGVDYRDSWGFVLRAGLRRRVAPELVERRIPRSEPDFPEE